MAIPVKVMTPPRTEAGVGFERVTDTQPRRRLVLNIDGLDKTGKTDFALTAPGPLYIQSFDTGLEGVVHKFQGAKEIYRKEYAIPRPRPNQDVRKVQEQAADVWNLFLKDYDYAIQQQARTILWDTATEIWELLRIARFGKLTEVMPHQYGPVNAEFRACIREALGGDFNLVMLHKVKDEYKGNSRTGNMKRAGFGEAGYMAQATLRKTKDTKLAYPDCFQAEITDCRMNPEVEGSILAGEQCTFPWLGVTIFPDSSLEDWQ